MPMRTICIQSLGCLMMCILLDGCSNHEVQQPEANTGEYMEFVVEYPDQSLKQAHTRVTGNHFDANDRIGLFVVQQGETLQQSGNYVNNSLLAYSQTAWMPAKPIRWDDGTYDVFSYYPYQERVSSVDDMPFSVSTDQNSSAVDGQPGGYEASDFLYAESKGVMAGEAPIKLQFKHRMSRLYLRLVKGEDFEGELPADAEVYIHNTVPDATIDLSVGIATRNPYASSRTIRAKSLGDHKYAAIIVPQRLDNRQPLIEVVMQGVAYQYESKFQFKQGMQHTVSLVINKNPEQVKIEIGGEVEKWD